MTKVLLLFFRPNIYTIGGFALMLIGFLLIPIGVGLFMAPIGIVIYLYGLAKPIIDLMWKNEKIKKSVNQEYGPFIKAIKNLCSEK